jgi:O-antigen/teichoic acid export membrane protein
MFLGLIPYIWLIPYNSALFAIGKSSAFFYAALFTLILNASCSIILVPKFGALGSGISFCIINVFGSVFNYYLYKRAMGKHLLATNQQVYKTSNVS